MPSESHRAPRPKELDLATPPITRNTSFSSDKPSLSRFASITSPPPTVSPEPAYIAVSAASQIITNDHENHHQLWYEEDGIEPSGETVIVTPGSIVKVNGFLDYILHRLLAVAKSTQLSSLRPAVTEVLKRKLSKEAISGADHELIEYMGGGSEDLAAYYNGPEPSGDWDLELAWKRTRLRCMVYSSLGDMEEEDEKTYAKEDNLNSPTAFGSEEGSDGGHGDEVVSPAVAIFLTSVLEFVGEKTLTSAGQAAYQKLRLERLQQKAIEEAAKAAAQKAAEEAAEEAAKSGEALPAEEPAAEDSEAYDPENEIAERVTVDEADTEKIAADPGLGRLWRTWKKSIRTQSGSFSRSFVPGSAGHQKRQSVGTASNAARSRNNSFEAPQSLHATLSSPKDLGDVKEETLPYNIPLPISKNDVDEIEVPGLAPEIDSDSETVQGDTEKQLRRSQSFTAPRPHLMHLATPPNSSARTPTKKSAASLVRAAAVRSRSAPSAERRPPIFSEPLEVAEADGNEADDEGEVKPKVDSATVVGNPAGEKFQGQEPGDNAPSKALIKEVPEAKSKQESDDASEQAEKTGVVAGVLAGAAALGTAALVGAGIVAAKKGDKDNLTEKVSADKVNKSLIEPLEISSKPDFETDKLGFESDAEIEDAEIFETTRLSMEGPKIVESRPRAVSATKSSTPDAQRDQIVKDPLPTISRGEDDEHDPNAIGLARTSNVSVPAVALPSSPHPSSRKASPEVADEPSYQERFSGASSADEDDVTTPKAKPAFVLAAPPASRARQQSAIAEPKASKTRLSPSTSGSLAPMSKTPGAEHGVPPLTPLRELMEAAHDTSDEASSIAPSHSASGSEHSVASLTQKKPHHTQNDSVTSDYSHVKQMSTSSSKYSDTKVQQPATAYPPPDRAAVQRVFTPPVPATEAMVRRSDSFGKNQRQIHTSGSGTSQVSHKLKGFIGLPHDSSEKAPSQLRTSEDRVGKKVDENFEKLMQSGETLQYTLTPQTVRETEAPTPQAVAVAQPVTKVHIHPTVTDGVAKPRDLTPPGSKELPRPNGTSLEDLHSSVHRSHPSFSRPTPPNGLRSNPPPSPRPPPHVATKPSKPYIPRSTPAPPSKRTKPLRPGMPEAREARATSYSTREISDFLRGTGPDGAPISQMNGGPRPAASSRSLARSTASSVRPDSLSLDGARSSSKQSNRTMRQRLQAREAVIPMGEATSELVEFIKQGPPSSSDPGVRSFAGPTGSSTPNIALSSSRPRPGASSSSGVAGSVPQNSDRAIVPKVDGPPETKRKQFRSKDPYDLDFVNDDEDDLAPTPKHERQESLADFLLAVTPPKDSRPQPLSNSAAAGQMLKAAQKSNAGTGSSTPVARSASRTSTRPNGTAGSKVGRINPSAAPPVRVAQTAPQLSLPGDSDAGSLGMDGYRLQSRGSDRNSGLSQSRMATGPRESRLTSETNANAKEVADFLRNSGPPKTSSTYAPPAKKPSGSFSRFFRRQKA
ncbi:MAG: hypothetical protein M1814_000848 [Vezdaea aestivalis]|nr:MAG: hypothetical protein M1814_000848 [Vezdaea aestivalis]